MGERRRLAALQAKWWVHTASQFRPKPQAQSRNCSAAKPYVSQRIYYHLALPRLALCKWTVRYTEPSDLLFGSFEPATMSAPSAHEYHHRQHLPPSPPPSPPVRAQPEPRKRRHKKKPDPFEQLATTPISSLPASPANDVNDNDAQEPLLKRVGQHLPALSLSFSIASIGMLT